ncbi:hypothetical protein ABPG74_011183 [Tetrahymena malaccensis]
MIVFLTFLLFLKSAISIISIENQTKSIEFDLDKCTYSGFINLIGSYICPIQVQVGSPSQQLTLSLAINKILPDQLIQTGMSYILSHECTQKNKCISLFGTKQFGSAFNSELSNSLNKTGIKYQNMGNSTLISIIGEYQSDLFQISQEIEQEIRIQFILIDSMWTFMGFQVGILNFERHNKNNLILQGYLQNKLKTPKFAIATENRVGKFIYDQIPESWDKAIQIPTKSTDLWDLKVTGLLLGEKEVLPLAHFQSIEFTFFPYTQLPKGIANYLIKKYPNLLNKADNTVQIKNCELCNCLEKFDFPDLKIFTEKVMIKLRPQQYFNYNKFSKFNCEFVISSNKLMLSSQFYEDNPTIFDTQKGTLSILNSLIFGYLIIILIKCEQFDYRSRNLIVKMNPNHLSTLTQDTEKSNQILSKIIEQQQNSNIL